jgi:predicted Zn-dependent protease
MRRRGLALIPIAAAIVFALFQYFSAPTSVDRETGRTIRGALSDEQSAALGLDAYRQVLAQERVVASGPEADLVREVAQRLTRVVGETAGTFDWQVSLVDSPQANAFCLPGGKIVVYTGILPVAKNADGLAAVMGHEIAHATLRHGSQRMLQTQIAQTVMQGAAVSASLSDMSIEQQRSVLAALGMGAQVGVLLPFSREHETEADQRGLLYAARAGYNPQEAIAFWERMEAAGGGQPPEFLSTHPSHGSRIARLREHMPAAMDEYEKARGR